MIKGVRNKTEMYPIIEGFSTSGLTHRSYCKRLGLKYGTYKYWLRKYKLDQVALQTKSRSNFISLSVRPTLEEKKEVLEVHYPNGVRLHLQTILDAQGLDTLKRLVLCLD